MFVHQPRLRVVAVVVLMLLMDSVAMSFQGLVLPPAAPPATRSVPQYPPNAFASATNSRIFSSGPISPADEAAVPVPVPAQAVSPRPTSPVPEPVVSAATQPMDSYVYEPQFQNRTIYTQQNNEPNDWFSVEALLWWTSHVNVPVIATTSPQLTPGLQAGVLGQPGTGVVFGGAELFDLAQGGFRIRGGHWFDRNDGSGWQGEFFMLGSRGHNFSSNSNGDPIVARPFTNALNGAQDARQVAYPGQAFGALNFNAETRLYSIGLNYWAELVEDGCSCCSSACSECGRPQKSCGTSSCDRRNDRVLGLKLGPRFIHLDETVLVDEMRTTVASGDQLRILDSFKSENSFLGGEIGLQARRQYRDLSLDLGLNLALGATRQELDVRGQTSVMSGGTTTLTSGGFYAQSTNSGSWHRDRFSLVPSLECAIGYELQRGWRFSVAYNLMYWTNVMRAAEQIDSTINPNLFPPSVATAADPARPARLFKEADYLAHGLSIGFEKRW